MTLFYSGSMSTWTVSNWGFVNSVSILVLVIDLFVYAILVYKSNESRNDSIKKIFQLVRIWVWKYDPMNFWISLVSIVISSLILFIVLVLSFHHVSSREIEFRLRNKHIYLLSYFYGLHFQCESILGFKFSFQFLCQSFIIFLFFYLHELIYFL